MLSTHPQAAIRPAAPDPGSPGGGGSVAPALPAARILVIRLGALGDVVRTRLAFAGLRALYPDARMDWLVEDRAAAGLVGTPGLDGIIEVPRRELRLRRPPSLWRVAGGLVRELRAARYDLAVDFHSILKSSLLARAARIPLRVGYARGAAREGSQHLMTHRVPLASPHVSRFERNAALVRFLGGEVPPLPPPVELPAGAEEVLSELPRELGDFVVIHPGTSPRTLYKRWDSGRYAEVASAVAASSGLPSVVTWGPVAGERERALEVVERAAGSALLAPRTRGVAQLLALLRRSRLFIGSDSGPVHLAALVGRPSVVVFGPTDPVENGPFPGVPSRILRCDVGCNPCRLGCPARTCMRAVDSAAVTRAALELIAGPRPEH